tara:strand:- start:27 stop:569 length:543 start_codon:yes stop_codon:yes gene_type:complete
MKEAINLKSKSGIHRLITSLEERGFIRRLKHKARAMEITKSLESSSNISINNSINIPLIGYIAAGNPIEAINNAEESIPVPGSLVSSNHKYFGLKIKGLSMIDEGIFDGDIAIIKKTSTVQSGKIAAVLTLENEITLKTIKYDQSKIFLIPANENYEIKEYKIGEIQVQGSLSGIIRKYN